VDDTSAEIFINEGGGVDSICVALINPSIVELRGELTPVVILTANQARRLAASLALMAEELDDR